MWFVYILRCADASYYVGETNEVNHELRTITEVAALRTQRNIALCS